MRIQYPKAVSLLISTVIILLAPLQLMAVADEKTSSEQIISQYYESFNAREYDKLYSLIDDNITHQFNFEPEMQGKKAFIDFITQGTSNYDEKVTDYVLMSGDDQKSYATICKIDGKYLKTDESGIEAKGQEYQIEVLNYFEIENNKITRAKCYFNEQDWVLQVAS